MDGGVLFAIPPPLAVPVVGPTRPAVVGGLLPPVGGGTSVARRAETSDGAQPPVPDPNVTDRAVEVFIGARRIGADEEVVGVTQLVLDRTGVHGAASNLSPVDVEPYRGAVERPDGEMRPSVPHVRSGVGRAGVGRAAPTRNVELEAAIRSGVQPVGGGDAAVTALGEDVLVVARSAHAGHPRGHTDRARRLELRSVRNTDGTAPAVEAERRSARPARPADAADDRSVVAVPGAVSSEAADAFVQFPLANRAGVCACCGRSRCQRKQRDG